MRIDHLEMALVHGQVDRLANRAAGMVHERRHIGELHEVPEVLDRAVAAALVEIVDEGRAVDRREDEVVAADLDVALGVAGVLDVIGRHGRDELARRGRAGKRTRSPLMSQPAAFSSSSARG